MSYQIRDKNIMHPPTAFKILGIERSDTREDIKKKFKDLVKQFHPDMSKKNTNKKFQEIKEAYEEVKISLFWNYPKDYDKRPIWGKPYLDMGGAGACGFCNKRFCQCSERQPGGICGESPEDYINPKGLFN